MGKQQDGISGGYSGRVGRTVGYNWRGKWCVRSCPDTINDARSEQQLHQRRLFVEMVRFASKATRILRISIDVAARNEGVTPGNLFVRMNKDCFALQDGELTVDLPSLRLSEGPVAPVAFDAPQLVDATTIGIAFEKNPLHRNCSQDDQIYIVAYCPEYKAFDFSDGTARRRRQALLQLNEAWVGKEVHLWGFVVDRAGRASQSLYIGSGVLDISAAADSDDEAAFEEGVKEEESVGAQDVVTAGKVAVAEGSAAARLAETPPGRLRV